MSHQRTISAGRASRRSASSPPPARTAQVRPVSSSTSRSAHVLVASRRPRPSPSGTSSRRTSAGARATPRRLARRARPRRGRQSRGQAAAALGRLAQPRRVLARELAALEPPRPVALDLARAGSCAPRCRGRARPAPGRSRAPRATASRARSAPSAARPDRGRSRALLLLRQRREPADRRVGVVRARVDDLVLAVVRAARAGCARAVAERPVEHGHARQARARRAARWTAGVITPRSSAITGSSPSARSTARKSSAPGPRRQWPCRAVLCRSGTPSTRRSRGSGRCATGRRARSTRRKRSIHQR